jgi:hypothetical protein
MGLARIIGLAPLAVSGAALNHGTELLWRKFVTFLLFPGRADSKNVTDYPRAGADALAAVPPGDGLLLTRPC